MLAEGPPRNEPPPACAADDRPTTTSDARAGSGCEGLGYASEPPAPAPAAAATAPPAAARGLEPGPLWSALPLHASCARGACMHV